MMFQSALDSKHVEAKDMKTRSETYKRPLSISGALTPQDTKCRREGAVNISRPRRLQAAPRQRKRTAWQA